MCLGWMIPVAWEWTEEVRSWPLTLCMQTVSGVSQLAFALVLNWDNFEKSIYGMLKWLSSWRICLSFWLWKALSCVSMWRSFKTASCYKLISKAHRRRKRKMSWHTLTSIFWKIWKSFSARVWVPWSFTETFFSLETASCLYASRLLI